jgi:cytochrome c oxidase subunit IV
MADTHDGGHGHGPMFRLYMVVAVALSGFTVISFVVNYFVREHGLPATVGFLLILGVAVAKASLVGLYFMHLKYDWGKLYFMIVPAFIIATMMMIVFLPDMVLAWHRDELKQQPAAAAAQPDSR